MRILVVAPYLYNEKWPEFSRNRTGFGIMLNEIIMSLQSKTKVCFFSHVVTTGHDDIILPHRWSSIVKGMRLKDFCQGIKWAFKYKQPCVNRLKYLYYCLNKGAFISAVKEEKPNIIHIHGIGFQTKVFIEACEEINIPYVVTLHGMIGLDEAVKASRWDKEFEKEFLLYAERLNIPVTVISTGMKNRIEKQYIGHESKNITVICNGTTVGQTTDTDLGVSNNLRKQYALSDSCKICVVVGSIVKHKNQIQVVEALKNIKTEYAVFFCGKDLMSGALNEIIKKEGLSDRMFCTGFLNRNELCEIYRQADINIVASISEGFGLSIIEAYSYGIPTVTFADLDAVPDLYDENAMILASNRSGEALANAVVSALKKEWDKEYIRKYAVSFSIEEMARRYCSVYNKLMVN